MSQMTNKRVLITGATGLIGSHLTRRLLDEGATVVAYGRSEVKLRLVFDQDLKNNALSIVVGNVAQGLSREEIGDVDYIFHAASPISGAEIKEKPVETIKANIDGTIHCLEYLKNQHHGRMVVFSSATVYGNSFSAETTVSEDKTDGADMLHIIQAPYSESKRMIEVLARAYAVQYHVDAVIVRISYAYGYSTPRPNTAFYEFIGKALNGEDVILKNAGMGRRDNIYVDDVVNGLLLVAEKGMTGEAYNLSSNNDGENYRAIDEMARIIVSVVNKIKNNNDIKLIIPAFEGTRRSGIKLDNSKIKQLGWKVTVSLADGIRETIRQYMN